MPLHNQPIMEKPIPETPPTPAPVQQAPAPVQTPQPPQPPQAPEPVMEAGGETNKIDWVGWGFMALGTTVLIVICWAAIRKARQSKRLADTQESLEQRVAKVEGIVTKMNTTNGRVLSFN